MYDNNGNELNQEEIQRMEQERRRAGLRKMAGDFSNGFKNGFGWDKNDVDAIKNRKGKNEGHGRPKDEDEEDGKKKKKSSLEEKDGLEKKDKSDKNDDKKEKKDKDDKKDKKTGLLGDKKKGEGFLKSKWSKLLLKIKILLIAAGVFLAVAIVVIISSALTMAIDAFKNAITNFFGISDKATKVDGEEVEGLYSEAYLYDDDGNELNAEDLVLNLKQSNKCGGTNGFMRFWNGAYDRVTNFFGIEGMSVCKFMREIQRRTEGTDLDRSLIISTVFYGYATQPGNLQYESNTDVPDDAIDATNHYDILKEVLSKDFKRSDFDKIIKYMQIDSKFERHYYEWKIDDSDPDKRIGKCERKSVTPDKVYNLDKWKIFMRFGEAAADKFDEINMITYGYNSSDEECIGEFTEEELIERIEKSIENDPNKDNIDVSLDSSVTDAIDELKDAESSSLSAFYQSADINSKTMDNFTSYGGITFDYKNGFAFNNFPGYKDAYNNPKINESYDSIFTPKYVETTIQEIISKKKDLNSVLLFDDPDEPDDFGNGGGRIKTGRCGDYLQAGYDEIDVKLTDCYGKELRTVSFEEYIIGVANGEVSDRSEDYVLSEMLAAMSYALKRHNNYTKGKLITMRSGTCDQVYCPLKEGCYSVPNPDICTHCSSYYPGGGKKYPQLYSKYQAYFAKAAQYLVVSNGMPHNCHYVSSIQNEWARKASQGMVFTQIIQETYKDEGAEVVKCSDLNLPVTTPVTNDGGEKIGNTASDEYPNVSPDLGSYYGFAYKEITGEKTIEINPDWEKENITTISPKCSNSEFASMKFRVNTKAVNAYEKAFEGVCKLLTEGIRIKDGSTCQYTMDDLKDGSTYVPRKTTNGAIDIHSYGIAQDWNYSQKYIINGKEYSPYNTRDLSEYLDFVNAIGGEEENCKNVNYILWLKAYKDAGFEWGGNFGRNGNAGEYDGKLFQIKYK